MAEADYEQEQVHNVEDLSGGTQTRTSRFLRRANEGNSLNARFNRVGGVSKRVGYTQPDDDLTSTTSTSSSTSTTTTSTSTSTTTSTSTSTTTTA